MPARYLAATLATASLAFATAACSFGGPAPAATGRLATESREVAAFDSVAVSVPGLVILRAGESRPVEVEADESALSLVETVVERGALQVRVREGARLPSRPSIRVVVTAPSLRAVSLAGSGDIRADRLAGPEVAVSVAGSGDVNVQQLEAGTLRLSIAGSGDFRAEGRADDVTVRLVGSGDVDTARLEARRVSVSLAGSGDAAVWATESLSASVAGSGDVTYRGEPAVKRSVAGSGTVRPARAGT